MWISSNNKKIKLFPLAIYLASIYEFFRTHDIQKKINLLRMNYCLNLHKYLFSLPLSDHASADDCNYSSVT